MSVEVGPRVKKITKVYNIFNINPWIQLCIRIIAVCVSWYFNKSILWAIVHYIFGIWYLLYALLTGKFADGGFMDIINHYF